MDICSLVPGGVVEPLVVLSRELEAEAVFLSMSKFRQEHEEGGISYSLSERVYICYNSSAPRTAHEHNSG